MFFLAIPAYLSHSSAWPTPPITLYLLHPHGAKRSGPAVHRADETEDCTAGGGGRTFHHLLPTRGLYPGPEHQIWSSSCLIVTEWKYIYIYQKLLRLFVQKCQRFQGKLGCCPTPTKPNIKS